MWMMSSTREGLAIVFGMLLSAVVGCSTQEKKVYDSVNAMPIVGDDALALRTDWPVSVAHYANGSVAAWSTRFPYDSATHPRNGDIFLDPAMFVVQTAALPVEFIANPPFQQQIWYGANLPPTHTAQPVLPPPGGAVVGPVLPYTLLGPQGTTPPTGLPGQSSAAQATATQLPAYPPSNVPSAVAPPPPPGAPGGAFGPPGR